jgi:HEAT repeat protein
MALGTSGNVAMVGPLAEALTNGEPRLRNAAIRGLGQIGGPEAQKALEHAARTHPDPATRRSARAKLRSGEALSARSDAP